MRKTVFITVLLLAATNALFAQLAVPVDPSAAGFIPQRLERIDEAINADIADGKIPGAVALVIRNGEIAYFESFGFADIDSQTALQNDNIFRISSMTKAVTSVATMILYEQGHFQLNDPVAKYIPEFADMTVVSEVDEDGAVSSTVAATKPIRIIDLLTHTSGISYPAFPGSVQKSYVDAGIIDGITSRDIVLASQMELLARQPLMFEPGSKYAYGLSFDLLGYLIEVISGKSLDQFFTDEIFAPLGMYDSYFYLPEDKADRLVTVHADIGDGGLIVSQGNEFDIIFDNLQYPVAGARSYFSGGAGLSSTAYDYGLFLQMLLNDGEFEGKRILSRKSVELMRTGRVDWDNDQVPDFGLGFSVVGDLGKKGELGSIGSYAWFGHFNTYFWVDPSEDLIGVFMSQVHPFNFATGPRFSALVYQALE